MIARIPPLTVRSQLASTQARLKTRKLRVLAPQTFDHMLRTTLARASDGRALSCNDTRAHKRVDTLARALVAI